MVGERTFGKGLLQDSFQEKDGSGLQLTVAKFLTPAGWDASRQGGAPPDRGCACHDHPRRHGGGGGAAVVDQCVSRALQLLFAA